MTQVYREEVPLAYWAAIMLGLFIAVLTPTFIREAYPVTREPRLLWLYLALDLIFVTVLLNFRKLVITIDSTQLHASFGLISKRVNLRDIRTCEPIEATLSVYTGIGVRYGGDGSLAFLPKLGDAVRVSFDTGRPFVFSTVNREKVIETLTRSSE